MAETFAFRARDARGAEQTGTLAAASSSAAARELMSRGWTPVDIRASAGPAVEAAAQRQASASGVPASQARLARRKRTQAGFSLLLRELAALLRAGVPLLRALQLAGDSSADATIRAALQRISRDLDNGHNLSSAAEREHRATGLLTPYDVAMIQVGEQTGRLPECFADLHRHREFVHATNEQVASALRYPLFVLGTCLAAIVVVNLFVLPSFAKVFAQARTPLPSLTIVLMAISSAMERWWPMWLAGAAGSVWGWRHWLGTGTGRLWWDRRKLRLPIVGRILEGIVFSRLSGALASGISAGLTISDSLAVASRTLDNAWIEQRLQGMRNDLARGASITAAARNMGVLPPTLLQLFAIGEESGSLEQLMAEISQHFETEVDYAIKKLSTTLEPVLIWFLGIGVLVLALGVFLPMWDLGRATIQ